jgi:hypothetical protein
MFSKTEGRGRRLVAQVAVLLPPVFLLLPLTMESGALFAQQPARTITFTDSFAPSPSALWNNYAGNWTASSGQYYAQSPNFAPLTYTGLPFVLTNYTLTVTTVIGDGGIWLRSNGNNPYGDYVLLVLGGDGYGQGDRGGTAGTSIYFATSSQSGLNQVDGVFTPGATYTITVRVVGDTYSVYVNNSASPVATFMDSTTPYGQVGLYDDQPNTSGGGFGLPTTFSNFSLTGTPAPPQITSFSPAGAKVSAEVRITGINLQSATAVTFNGMAAKFTQEYPSTTIVAIVPDLATTGPIEVITPIGTAGIFTVLP